MAKTKPHRYRSSRCRRWGIQMGVLLLLLIVLGYFGINLSYNLAQLDLPFGFDFLTTQAGFGIGDAPVSYSPTDAYARALWIGLLNTLRVVGVGLILTTVLGIVIGIARLSDNWLVRQLAALYVETLRNTPLLLQLLFLYFAVFLGLPKFEARIQWPGPIWLSNQGLQMPWPRWTAATGIWITCLGLGLLSAVFLWRWQTRRQLEQGQTGHIRLWPWMALGLSLLVAFGFSQQAPFVWSVPAVDANGQALGGLQLSSEFATLLIGLTLYTAAFIAEIVRAGITSVAQGQWEAARALGLHSGATLRLVVFPQALRVIVPPLTSQYLNLAKNSSLALVTGYPDLYSVSSTTANQTGRDLEVLLLLMATYLFLSLFISWTMNQYNRRIQWAER